MLRSERIFWRRMQWDEDRQIHDVKSLKSYSGFAQHRIGTYVLVIIT